MLKLKLKSLIKLYKLLESKLLLLYLKLFIHFENVIIFKAGPEMKAKLLNGLGLKGYLVSDGKNPINLFNTANGS